MRFFMHLVMITLIAALPSATLGSEDITGTFQVKEGDQVIGAERFSIVFEDDGRVKTESQGTIKEGKTEVRDFTRLVMRTLDGPIHTYQREVQVSELPRVLGATYQNGELLIERREGPRKTESRLQISPATLPIDIGIWHQLHLVLQRYSHRIGGEQKFTIVLPSGDRLIDNVTLKLLGSEAVSLQDGYYKANKYFFNRRDQGMIIWADTRGEILRIESPMQGLVVERIKYEGERAEEVNPVKFRRDDITYESVRVPGFETELAGVLTKPLGLEGRLPVVIFLSDSGPHDRDGINTTSNIDVGTNTLLDTISKSGFAVLRLDDRGVGESGGDIARNSMSVQALDAAAMIQYLKQRPDIDPARIALAGQGEGANAAIMVAAKEPDSLQALVLLSPSDVSLTDLAIEQVKRRLDDSGQHDPEAWRRSGVAMLIRIAQEKPDQEIYVMGDRPVFLDLYREWAAMKPLEEVRKTKAKILHVQPEMDLQIFPQHAEGFKKALSGEARYTFKSFAGLNHFFKPSVGTIGEYADPTTEVSEAFVTYVSDWLKANL